MSRIKHHPDIKPGATIIYRRYRPELEKLMVIQVYTLRKIRPHTTRKGVASAMLYWDTRCMSCSCETVVRSGMTLDGMVRRCLDCRKADPTPRGGNRKTSSYPLEIEIRDAPKPPKPAEIDDATIAASLF